MKVDLKCTMDPDGKHIVIHETWHHQTIKTLYSTKSEIIRRQLEHKFITQERSLDEVVSLFEDILAVNKMEISPNIYGQLQIMYRDGSNRICKDQLG